MHSCITYMYAGATCHMLFKNGYSPAMSDLSPVVQRIDAFQSRAGNTGLSPYHRYEGRLDMDAYGRPAEPCIQEVLIPSDSKPIYELRLISY